MAEGLWVTVAIIGIVNCATFIVGYNYKTGGTWRRYPMGRHLMGFIIALGAAFVLMAASLMLGPLGPWPWILTLTGLNLVVAQRNWLLFTRRWRSTGSEPTDDTVRERR